MSFPVPFADALGNNEDRNAMIQALAGGKLPASFGAADKADQGGFNAIGQYRTPSPPPDMSFDGREIGIQDEMSGPDALRENAMKQARDAQIMFGLPPGPRPQVDVLPEGENYHLAGGAEGKKNYQTAYDPDPAVNAIMNAQVAEKDRNEAMAASLQAEQARQKEAMAAIMARRQEYATQLEARQKTLDENVLRYSADLSNQNKFWQNPGNIISAIAFSLMPIAGGDPAAGARLINQAVEADFGRRLNAANMHLGELRSNIANYRAMAGNAQAGDMLAESEARRIAAQDIERISLQFASPISKAKAEAAIADQRMRSAQLRMQAYKILGIHQDPRIVPKAIGNAVRAGGADGVGFTPFGPGSNPAKGAVAGQIAPGVPTTASTGGSLPGTRVAALAANAANAPPGAITEPVRQAMTGQLAPKDSLQAMNAILVERVRGMHPGNPVAQKAAMEELQKRAEAGAAEISKNTAKPMQDAQAIMSLQMKLDYIEKYYTEVLRRDPQEFMQSTRDLSAGWTNTVNELRLKYGNDNSPEAQAAKRFLAASQSVYQEFARLKTKDTHDLFGAALTEKELEQLQLSITNNPSFKSMSGWVRMVGAERQAMIKNAIKAGGSPEAQLLYLSSHPGMGGEGLGYKGIPGPGPMGPVEGQKPKASFIGPPR